MMTEHSLTALRRAAVAHVTCRRCGHAPTERCTADAEAARVVTPHDERIEDAALWFTGYDFAVREGGLKTQLTNALHDLEVAVDQVGTLTDDVRDAARRANVAEDQAALVQSDLTKTLEREATLIGQAASLTEQLKTARIGAALVPGLQQQIVDLLAKIAKLENPTPDPEPEPTPTRLPFGIGTCEKAASSAFPMLYKHTELEAEAGVKFAYLHEYFTFPAAGVLTALVAWCETQFKAGRVPVPTAKLPGGDWAGGAAGKYDATIKATVDAVEALAVKYGSRVIFGLQHEPDNDGKTLALWKALLDHVGPIFHRPGRVEFWTNYTGWAQLYGDAGAWKIDDLPTPDYVDGVAFNSYLSLGGSSTKLTSMRTAYLEKFAAWAKSRGVQVGVWETGLNEDAAVTAYPEVKTWIVDTADDAAELGYTMWLYWNNRVDAAHEDWRISKTLPANKLGQMVTAMKKYARR